MKLIIPPKVSNTAPKPTKAQIVEALLKRAVSNHEEERKALEARREVVRKELKEEVLKELAKKKPTDFSISLCESWGGKDVEAEITMTNAKISALKDKLKSIRHVSFDEKEVKAKINESLKPTNPLLGDSNLAKSLDAMLAAIFNTTPVIEA